MSDKKYILIGDSITEWGAWDNLLPPHKIINLGVAGNKVNQVYERIVNMELNCDKLFLLIGVNNLGDGDRVEYVMKDYGKLLDLIFTKLDKSKINLISVLPIDEGEWINPNFGNRTIEKLNSEIKLLSKKLDLNYIKMDEKFLNYSNPKELYTDGLHLSEKGYELYSNELLKLL